VSAGSVDESGGKVTPGQPAWASPDTFDAGLTPREWEVLAILVTGAATREISARLHISPRTVTNHLGNIYRKLGVRTRSEAVAYTLGTTGMRSVPSVHLTHDERQLPGGRRKEGLRPSSLGAEA
jgi:DNA-binding CsgD family transcriptional regulator